MFDNLKAKIAAVFLASILWFFIVSSHDQIRSIDNMVNIVPINLSNDLAILNQNLMPKLKVYYKVKDSNTSQLSVGVNDVLANIDLEGLLVGEHKIPVTVDITHPGVEVVKFTPSILTIVIEPKVNKDFAPEIEHSGNVADGYILNKLSTDIDSVVVTGAKSIIEQVSTVKAEVQLIGVESTDHSKRGTLFAYDIYDKKIEEVSISPSNINIDLDVGLDEETKTVGIIPDLDRVSLQDGYFIKGISIEPPVALIRGKHSILESIEYLPTIRLTINNLSKDYTTSLDIELPSDVSIISPKDNRVTLHIELESLTYKREIEPVINSKNLSSMYDLVYEDPIILTVTGDPATLDNIEKNDISFNIDFSDMNKLGTYRIEISKSDFIYPQGISLEDYTPKIWEISIVYK